MEQPYTPEQPRKLDITLLPATPALIASPDLTAHFFEAFENTGSKALVITGYASGTTPSILNPFIKGSVERGVPVFVLSNNPGDEKGPQRITYGVHQEAVDAGATILRDVNINRGAEVLYAIQDAIDDGKTGQELAQALIDIYGTPGRELPTEAA